jgi:hypothetical protein
MAHHPLDAPLLGGVAVDDLVELTGQDQHDVLVLGNAGDVVGE